MRPAKGSARVLKTKATRSPSSDGSSVSSPACTGPLRPGEGRSSTSASSSRLVPRLRVAAPQVTGKIVPAVTPALSAPTVSSWEISSPSR